MKGDFSRLRFNPARQYTSVLQQQGRVALDADANEQCFIDEYLRDVVNNDVIGPVGGPVGDAGFALKLEGGQILIEPGRYYVDGLLVENLTTLRYDDQPYLNPRPLASQDLLAGVFRGKGSVTAQFVLEVWQRLVTDLDDSCLREPALGQADTTARLQTVWRVVGSLHDSRSESNQGDESAPDLNDPFVLETQPVPSGCSNAMQNPLEKLSSCCQSLYKSKGVKRTGSMGADTSVSADCGCQPIPAAGYQGLENQLYRVEIHHSGTLDTATLKWSRENASVVTQITEVNGPTITVSSLGPDVNLGFQAGQWVELTDDNHIFGIFPNLPGVLYQIYSVQTATMQVTFTNAVTTIDIARNARMRRWDQSSVTSTANGIPLSSTPIQLENGIEVTFAKGDYITGDYWTIPARTANGKIDWPPCGAVDKQFFQAADFTPIYTAPLACIHSRKDLGQGTKLDTGALNFDPTGGDSPVDGRLFVLDDCRLFFPPLTALCGNSTPSAMHVQSVNWNNDDYMTLDTLIANGLEAVLDQTPASPISGASFCVTFEIPGAPANAPGSPLYVAGDLVPSTVLREVAVVDSNVNVTQSGSTLSWQLPMDTTGNTPQDVVIDDLDKLLAMGAPAGWFTRVRVRLMGRAIFAQSNAGNLYLDGQTLSKLATRTNSQTTCVGLQFPSGNGETASDFESWFYLAPIVRIVGVVIQQVDPEGHAFSLPNNTAQVLVNSQNQVTGLRTGETQGGTGYTLRALITLNYVPIASTPVTLTFSGTGAGTVVSIAGSVSISPGQTTAHTPINVLMNPGAGVSDKVQLIATLQTALGTTIPFDSPPQLTLTGSTPP